MVKEDLGPALGHIFQNITLLFGIKEPISEINKADIKKMITSHYNNLSLEQLVYAFELERYGKLGDKTDHFQLINAQYVATVIKKYKKWLSETRFNNNIPMPSNGPKLPEPILSEKEKEDILKSGCTRCFNEFKEYGRVKDGNTHIYDYLIKDLKVHKFSEKEIEAAKNIALRDIKEESKTLDRIKAKETLRLLQNGGGKRLENKVKTLLLTNYFNSLGNKSLDSIINVGSK